MRKGTCTTSRRLRSTSFLTLLLLSLPLISISCQIFEADVSTVADDVTIVKPSDATAVENLATKEIRRYLRAIGKVNCTWTNFNAAMKKVKDQKNPDDQKRLARQLALPLRKELVVQIADVHRYLLATVNTNGAMGNVANWQQHIMPTLLTEPGQELAKILGEDLPADAKPSNRYVGPLRIIVTTVRTSLNTGEDLKLKVIILAHNPPEDAALYWRAMGKGTYNRSDLMHIARGVYSVKVPANRIKTDLEYYVRVSSSDGQQITFPASAPQTNQTIIVNDGSFTN